MSGYAISGGDIIDVYAGGHLDNRTLNWLTQRNESIMQTVTDTARTFFQHAHSLYNMVSSSDATMLLRNLKVKTENSWSFDIAPIHDLVGLQTANPYLQRFILAQPDLRERYLNQEVEGYGDSYVNHYGNTIGERHFDYRRVMGGIATIDAEGLRYTTYHEQLSEEERELTVFEKVDILKTWNTIQKYLDIGEDDPTSVTGAML